MITQQDIATKLGLSRATISKALKNNPEIPKETCERIQTLASEMGYHPNPLGAGLARFKNDSKTAPIHSGLAWINCWPDPKQLRSYTEFDLYWQGAQGAADKLGYRLEEFVCGPQMSPARLEKILIARGILGIIIPPQMKQPDWDDFRWDRFSVVRLGRSLSVPNSHIVTADQVANTMTAMDEVRERGYRRIGFVGSDDFSSRRWLFEGGFFKSQLEIPEVDRVSLFAMDRVNPFLSQEKFTHWLKQEKPDALISACWQLADMVKTAGYRIPQDIGIAAMSILDGHVDAGIDQNPMEIGRVAVLMVASLINDNAFGIPEIQRELLVKGKWVDGASLPLREAND